MACAMVFAQSPINFDGILSEGEWENAHRFSINYEIQPGNNSQSPNKTEVYVLYSPTHIFVGFDAKANMATLHKLIPKLRISNSVRHLRQPYNQFLLPSQPVDTLYLEHRQRQIHQVCLYGYSWPQLLNNQHHPFPVAL